MTLLGPKSSLLTLIGPNQYFSNLNDVKMNYPFADILATKRGKAIAISVKTRNRFMKDGRLNSRYKLGLRAYEKANLAAKEFSAEPHWMAIQFDAKSYTIWLGTLDELDGNKGILIRKCLSGDIGQCLVSDKPHYFDFSYFKN